MKNKELIPKVPRGLRVLPTVATANEADGEYNLLKAEAAKIEQWWTEDRWNKTKRVYSGKCRSVYVYV